MNEDQTFAIVGAGQAGGWAAKTLRDEGFGGRVLLIGDEIIRHTNGHLCQRKSCWEMLKKKPASYGLPRS